MRKREREGEKSNYIGYVHAHKRFVSAKIKKEKRNRKKRRKVRKERRRDEHNGEENR